MIVAGVDPGASGAIAVLRDGKVSPATGGVTEVPVGRGDCPVDMVVSELTEGGPAEKAKLRVGDIIVRVDGKRVETVNELIDMVQDKPKGEKVKLEVLRDKKAMTFEVEVADEESGGLFESDGLRSFLESWQGYTDALQKELRTWDSERSPLVRQLTKGFALKGKARRI